MTNPTDMCACRHGREIASPVGYERHLSQFRKSIRPSSEAEFLVPAVSIGGAAQKPCRCGTTPGLIAELGSHGRISVIDNAHQEQAVRWGCRASVPPLARVQNSGHRVRGELGPTNGHE